MFHRDVRQREVALGYCLGALGITRGDGTDQLFMLVKSLPGSRLRLRDDL